MTAVQRVGDANNAGGTITTTPQTTVYANGLLVSVNGATVSSHAPNTGLHLVANCRTSAGSGNVFINNIPVTVTNAQDNCSHVRSGGSPNVFVN